MTTASNLKLGSSLSQESLAAVQKKEYLCDDVEHPSSIEICNFFLWSDAKFNYASKEIIWNSIGVLVVEISYFFWEPVPGRTL